MARSVPWRLALVLALLPVFGLVGGDGLARAASWPDGAGQGGLHDPWDVDAVIAAGPVIGGDGYHDRMFDVFVGLARDREAALDWPGVEFYLDKAKRMLKGGLPDPTMIYPPLLMRMFVAPLQAARARFLKARDSGGRSLAPRELARAHGVLDCWIRQAMENRVGVEGTRQGECRIAFDRAMREVEQLMAGDAVVLLPDPTGAVGALVLSARNGQGDLMLNTAGAGGSLGSEAAPRQIAFSEQDTAILFGDALAARPEPPRRFTVEGFRAGDAALPPGAGAVIGEIVADARRRGAYDVQIVGFTDTVGDAALNERLAGLRADAVRTQLMAAGLDPVFLDVAGQGETLLAVQTDDDVDEERNRRVVVTVR